MAIEIVELPIKFIKNGDVPVSFLYVYQRVSHRLSIIVGFKNPNDSQYCSFSNYHPYYYPKYWKNWESLKHGE